ncbi:hypothetical protein JQC91_06015 [Jannaschia sp. Os4]|uniref:glycosyltransferase n=1 Tax=Jannaschia sp. Os4 TaxID=2807617 RepID=UPI00193AD261|nr:glycosyltransferase [Jannaschia sp. Os4]MBM2575853.1 hypothetical protein [Jannaschia sp. Os4]
MRDVTCILTVHDEGSLARPTVRSFDAAVARARAEGLAVETVLCLDRADAATRDAVADLAARAAAVIETDLGDQGAVRNGAAARAGGACIAFLDGDDLWSSNWLVEAWRCCAAAPGRAVAHPEIRWTFDGLAAATFPPDMRDPDFDWAILRCENVYDALCMAPADLYRAHPFGARDLRGGFAYEDWHWAMTVAAAGASHRVAPGTVIFKRARAGARNAQAQAANVIPRWAPPLRWDWTPPDGDGAGAPVVGGKADPKGGPG